MDLVLNILARSKKISDRYMLARFKLYSIFFFGSVFVLDSTCTNQLKYFLTRFCFFLAPGLELGHAFRGHTQLNGRPLQTAEFKTSPSFLIRGISTPKLAKTGDQTVFHTI